MKKITLLALFIFATTLGFSQNLITNGTFDDATGWTPFEIHAAGLNIGEVTIANGVATFTEVDDPEWTHLGIATSVYLDPGVYQFDMDVSFDGVWDSWGEVFVGTTMPAPNTDYTDNQILTVHHTWGCGGVLTYSGPATATGCDGNADPGKFTISTAGTYYVVYKAGGSTIGVNGIVIDNMSLVSALPSPVANFTATTSTSNLDAIFTNTSTDATDYSWDFGDGNSSTDENPTHTYAADGPYTVTLTATNTVGSSQVSKSLVVGNPTNLITNGTFDDATGWTIVNHYEATNTFGNVSISGGIATWSET
ncbi:MAG: PKD domain-containing protein, partial [Bacteroidia bacterium]|nr:PKD domain-containing protein [Bacteroidia bacterium]